MAALTCSFVMVAVRRRRAGLLGARGGHQCWVLSVGWRFVGRRAATLLSSVVLTPTRAGVLRPGEFAAWFRGGPLGVARRPGGASHFNRVSGPRKRDYRTETS